MFYIFFTDLISGIGARQSRGTVKRKHEVIGNTAKLNSSVKTNEPNTNDKEPCTDCSWRIPMALKS